jgi:uncharacterized protein
VASLLLEKGANINIRELNRGYTALHEAVERGDSGAIRFLIDNNADLRASNSCQEQPPLHLAVHNFALQVAPIHGHGQTDPKIIELLSEGDSVNVTDSRGQTALHLSVRRGCLSAVKILVQREASINTRDISGRTALHTLASNRPSGSLDLLEYLLSLSSLDATIRDKLGYTALHLAVKSGQPMMVSKLSEAINEPIEGLERIESTGMTATVNHFLSLIDDKGG